MLRTPHLGIVPGLSYEYPDTELATWSGQVNGEGDSVYTWGDMSIWWGYSPRADMIPYSMLQAAEEEQPRLSIDTQ